MSIADDLKHAVRQDQMANSRFEDVLARFLGINRTDSRCIDLIAQHGRLTAGQLAAYSGLTSGAVTVLIDRLERAGYVVRQRDADDRRKVWVELTGHASAIGKCIYGQFGDIGEVLAAGFSSEQLEAVARYLLMSASLNTTRAKLLEKHVPEAGAGQGERMNGASAFEREVRALKTKLQATQRAGEALDPERIGD